MKVVTSHFSILARTVERARAIVMYLLLKAHNLPNVCVYHCIQNAKTDFQKDTVSTNPGNGAQHRVETID